MHILYLKLYKLLFSLIKERLHDNMKVEQMFLLPLDQVTTRNRHFAVCTDLCRVPDHERSAKRSFAERQTQGTRRNRDTRHIRALPSAATRQKISTHRHKPLPSALRAALGKIGACGPHAAAVHRSWVGLTALTLTRMRLDGLHMLVLQQSCCDCDGSYTHLPFVEFVLCK